MYAVGNFNKYTESDFSSQSKLHFFFFLIMDLISHFQLNI